MSYTEFAPASRDYPIVFTSGDGNTFTAVAVTGTVSVPQGTPPAGGWPVVVWTHGTTGLAAVCGPSRDDADGPEHGYITVIRGLLDQVVAGCSAG